MASSNAKIDISRKIKTKEELQQIIGPFPREKVVVLSHGIFDIVHPGHIRHLMYAKDRADILIACITCDKYIGAVHQNLFIPQDLRALNLAALEFVDYVLIDEHLLPLETISFLKPNLFAKGYASTSEESQEHRNERDAVLAYGGEVLLTPGDVTNLPSISSLGNQIQLSIAKLLILMQSEGVTFDSLRKALQDSHGARIHIIGDALIDVTTYCTPTGGVTKSPTVSVVVQRDTKKVGGAAMVALNFVAAGASVILSTVLGDDDENLFIQKELQQQGVEVEPIIDGTRPTPVRTTYIAQGHHLLRTNSFDGRIISEKVTNALSRSISATAAEGYVFCDCRFGIFAKNTIPPILSAVPPDAFTAADSHVASRWGNVLEFQNFDLIAPNEREARFAIGDQDSTVRPLALEVFTRAKCKLLLLKLGDRGVLAYRAASHDPKSFFTVDSFAERVVDAAGAGDAFLAYATVGMLRSKSEVIAAILGSVAAAIVCERGDHEPVSVDDVLTKISTIELMARSSNAFLTEVIK